MGIPFAITPIGQLHQSPPSPIPGDLGRGLSHQSHVLEHRDTYGQAQVCSKGHQGSSLDRPCQPSFHWIKFWHIRNLLPQNIRLLLSVLVCYWVGQGEWNLSWTTSDGKKLTATITPIRPLPGDSAPLGVINTAATRGGNGSQPRGGGVTGLQGRIPHKKKTRRRKPPCRGPKSPPWWTTVLNLEFKPWPFVIGAPSSHVRHFVVFLSRGFFLPEISAQPPSGAGLRAEWGW